MYVTSTGMVCPVGLSAPAGCAAMRAGIAKFDELPYEANSNGKISGAMIPELVPNLKRKQRLIEMLAAAVKECINEKPDLPLEEIPLVVGVAEPGRPGGGAAWAEDILKEVQEHLEVEFHPTMSRVIPKGHTSGFEGLRVARKLFKDPGLPACLVCGVDSYINASSLCWLEQSWRLKMEDHSDGVIPGEAAAAVLMEPESSNSPTLVQVLGLGFAEEKTHVMAEEPLLGLGLAEAARTALSEASLQMNEIDFRFSDVTGESYGFKEQALTMGRVMRNGREELPIWHCSESIGDTGAAAGVCQLVIAFHAFVKRYAPGERAICFTSAVPGDRASVVLHGRIRLT